MSIPGGTGEGGRIQIAGDHSAAYINCPIEIGISQRGLGMPSRLFIFFANLNGTDPALGSFTYAGKIKSAYINRTAAGVWDVYVEKTETYDTVGVVDFKSPPYMSGLTVAWTKLRLRRSLPERSRPPMLTATARGCWRWASSAGSLRPLCRTTEQGQGRLRSLSLMRPELHQTCSLR